MSRGRWVASGIIASLSLSAASVGLAGTPTAGSGVGAESEAERAFLALPLVALEEQAGQPKPGELKVGDEIRYQVSGLPGAATVKAAPGAQSFLDQGVNIRIVAVGDPLVVGLAPLKPGEVGIEPLVFEDANGNAVGRTDPLHLPPVKSAIEGNDENAGQPAPARAPVTVGFPAWLIALITVALLALFAAVVRGIVVLRDRFRNRRKPVEAPVAASPKSPDVVALEELALIESRRFAEAGKFKPHYFGISETLKKYFGARYGFDARESTSHELILELERRAVAGDGVLDRLEKAFELLDRVKFTDHSPDSAEPAFLLEEAREMVRRTRRELAAPSLLPPGGKGN